MRKLLRTLIILCLSASVSLSASAQGKITTKKLRLSDFTTKTTKIVLTGNAIMDEVIKEGVSRHWRISPYEFCTMDEYSSLRRSTDYYFLRTITAKNEKDKGSGITTLSLSRGGAEEDKDYKKEAMDVIDVPIAYADSPSGREFIFISAFLDIIQEYVIDSMTSDKTGYMGLNGVTKNLGKAREKDIYFSMDDLAPELSAEQVRNGRNIFVEDEDTVDDIFSRSTNDAIVSYVICPDEPVVGAFCYKMLISADTHELYYFSRHKLSQKAGPGFLPKDLRYISAIH